MPKTARGVATAIAESRQTPPSKSNSANINQKRIWFDGSTTQSGKGGREGWAVVDDELNILVIGSTEASPENSSQRSELKAFRDALRCVPTGSASANFEVVGDSKYAINLVAEGWLQAWKERGWRKKGKSNEQPCNLDLLAQIDFELSLRPEVSVKWERRRTSEPGKLVDDKSREAAFTADNKRSRSGGEA